MVLIDGCLWNGSKFLRILIHYLYKFFNNYDQQKSTQECYHWDYQFRTKKISPLIMRRVQGLFDQISWNKFWLVFVKIFKSLRFQIW